MSKTYVANGTGSGQTLSELDSDKIPVYSTEADLDTDLANLADGELALYPSEGASLSVPIDEVKSGDMHAVTSNAVAEAMKYCINSADRISISSTTWTAIEDVYVNFMMTNTSNVSNYNLKINDIDVCTFDSLLIAGTTYYIIHFSGIVKKGDVLTSSALNNSNNCRVFKLK